MIFGSLFSGIGAPECAWVSLGWRCAWQAEIDPFASAVLAHRFPEGPNLGDVTRIEADAIEPVDLVVFGSPCQSFSVAGKRLGLDDPRGNLALVALRLVGKLRPRWMVFENVPGLLSSDGGRDFGAFLGLLGECGYGVAYRVLDAQHFGVPQRRRRVFVVGYLGDWRPAAAVLFEPESLRGDPASRREAGERVAASLTRGAESDGKGGYAGRHREDDENLIANPLGAKRDGGWRGDLDNDTFVFGGNRQSGPLDVATAVNAHGGPHGRLDFESETFVAHSLRADGFDASEDGTGRGTPLVSVAFQEAQTGVREYVDAGSLRANGPGHDPVGTRIRSGMSVRRLTPRECERLQGFPDDWTLIRYRGKPAADGPRYRSIGNSMALPCIGWIGHRIQFFESAMHSLAGERAA